MPDPRCPICLEPASRCGDGVRMRCCAATVHERCHAKWLASGGRTCVACRARVRRGDAGHSVRYWVAALAPYPLAWVGVWYMVEWWMR